MARYRKILVAFDGSATARDALAVAGRLADAEKSWIKVLAVVPSYEGDLELVGVSRIRDTIIGPGEERVNEAKRIAAELDLHILTDVAQGEPYERIVTVAAEENCDLIVMGRQGYHLEREFMGSVTARVIGHTNKDVLVVPDNAALRWNHVLLATDGSPYSQAAVAKAIDLARDYGAPLTAVSVVYANDEFSALAPEIVAELGDRAGDFLGLVKEEAAAAGVALETVIKEGEPHRVIASLADSIDAGLVIMGSHGRKGLTRLLMGSVTERVIGYVSCPVLVSHLQ